MLGFVRAPLAREQLTDRPGGFQALEVRGAQVRAQGARERDQGQLARRVEHLLRRRGVALDVPIPVGSPLRESVGRGMDPATHQHDASATENPRPLRFEPCEVRVRTDRHDGRAALDACGHERDCCSVARGSRNDDRATPERVVIGQPAHRCAVERGAGTGGDRDVVATGEPEHVLDVAGTRAVGIGGCGDSAHLDVGPTEEHRERRGIVGVAREVGVEMHEHERNRGSATSRRCDRRAHG